MDEFEAHRPHLHAVATRILGSRAEADDALQEAWIRVDRADTSDVDNVAGWLTTVVSRVCLTMLDARKRRREEALEAGRLPDPVITRADDAAPDPEGEALAADGVGAALLVVLETLRPAERLAFVLHDIFAVPFEDIAPIVDRSPDAARQLASRARRRVQGADRDAPTADRKVVDAFLAAARGGDFEGLLAVLDPDVVLRVDDGSGALQLVKGARAVATRARFFSAQPRGAPGDHRRRGRLRRDRGRPTGRGARLHHRRRPDHGDRRAARAGPARRTGPRGLRRGLRRAAAAPWRRSDSWQGRVALRRGNDQERVAVRIAQAELRREAGQRAPLHHTTSPSGSGAGSTSTPLARSVARSASTSPLIIATPVSTPAGRSGLVTISDKLVCDSGGATSTQRSPDSYVKSLTLRMPSTPT